MSDDGAQDRPELDGVTEWSDGVSWIADPDEKPRRASHALATETGVLVVDPVDAEGLDGHLSDLGTVAGVVVLQDRHTRDATAVAERHDVSVFMPEWMDLGAEKLDGEPEPLGSALSETGYESHELFDTDDWEEAVLVDESAGTMVVPEAVGTSPGFTPDGEVLGVHPVLDEPPTRLGDWDPERILVGHGESIYEDGGDRLQEALQTA
ncbi:hypothetical protein GRX03_06405 [Halovenus sp. WSH3]|uniref:MBL fold metallo-hydrolase n=1 Tax=Halovenus carboxidivorans TaxID=2692199 RepID=A0A6B0SZV4_9EURY|nr:hypothetical protein [Halovenus carboxidivorans]MXR51234.1 hypothetical protein [Halovenus carboxidivorans]